MTCNVSSLAWVANCLTVTFFLLILITKVKRVLRKNKYKLRYWMLALNLVDFVVSKAVMNHPLDRPRHFYTVQSYFP